MLSALKLIEEDGPIGLDSIDSIDSGVDSIRLSQQVDAMVSSIAGRPLLESFAFRVTLVACLIFALFGGGLCHGCRARWVGVFLSVH